MLTTSAEKGWIRRNYEGNPSLFKEAKCRTTDAQPRGEDSKERDSLPWGPSVQQRKLIYFKEGKKRARCLTGPSPKRRKRGGRERDAGSAVSAELHFSSHQRGGKTKRGGEDPGSTADVRKTRRT